MARTPRRVHLIYNAFPRYGVNSVQTIAMILPFATGRGSNSTSVRSGSSTVSKGRIRRFHIPHGSLSLGIFTMPLAAMPVSFMRTSCIRKLRRPLPAERFRSSPVRYRSADLGSALIALKANVRWRVVFPPHYELARICTDDGRHLGRVWNFLHTGPDGNEGCG